jgi:hypothetical protein
VHEDVFDRSIDVQILRLRRKLERDPSAPRVIQTERGVGYVFAVAVERACGATGGGLIPAGALSGGLVGTQHSGGIVGSESGPARSVSPLVFAGAPRFHSGGLVSGEVPIIAKSGEGIFTAAQMRALAPVGSGGGSAHVQVNVINQADGTTVKTQKRRDGNIDIHDIIISTVGKHMANGGYDPQLRARTGQIVQPRGR